jgi:hypothetical protein
VADDHRYLVDEDNPAPAGAVLCKAARQEICRPSARIFVAACPENLMAADRDRASGHD